MSIHDPDDLHLTARRDQLDAIQPGWTPPPGHRERPDRFPLRRTHWPTTRRPARHRSTAHRPGFLRPDGQALAVNEEDGVALWDLNPDHQLEAECRMAGRKTDTRRAIDPPGPRRRTGRRVRLDPRAGRGPPVRRGTGNALKEPARKPRTRRPKTRARPNNRHDTLSDWGAESNEPHQHFARGQWQESAPDVAEQECPQRSLTDPTEGR